MRHSIGRRASLACTTAALLLTGTLAGCASTRRVVGLEPAAEARVSAVSREEYGIYGLVIDQLLVRRGKERIVVVARTDSFPAADVTRAPSWLADVAREMPVLEQALVRDLTRRNAQPWPLDSSAVIPSRLKIVYAEPAELARLPRGTRSTREMRRLPRGSDPEHYWSAFYAKYPRSAGLVSFSRVAFNPRRTRAAVTVEATCGSICAEAFIVVLARERGRWKVLDVRQLWTA